MATTKLSNLLVAGVRNTFMETYEGLDVSAIYRKHCMTMPSDKAVETYAFPGALPVPRQLLNGRQIQNITDYKFTVTNNEYELTLVIDRNLIEDDQTGLIMQRVQEVAEGVGTYKDFLFASMLIAGGTSGSNGFDGVTFYSSDHSSGSLAQTIDNDASTAVTGTTANAAMPTSAEFILSLTEAKTAMLRYADDQGRPFNNVAAQRLGVIIPPDFEKPAREALNATIISQTSNVFTGYAELDMAPYLTGTDRMYVTAVGAARKPFIFQERTPLEVVVFSDPQSMVDNNGLKIAARERFVFAYGDPRRSYRQVYT